MIEERHRNEVVVFRHRIAEINQKMVFLEKHKAKSVLEAVKKSTSAAREFMDCVSKGNGFGTLKRANLCAAIQKAVKGDKGAAQVLLEYSDLFSELLGEEGMRDALWSTVFGHKNCMRYFMEHFETRFSGVSGAKEAYLAVEGKSRKRAQIVA